jgi:RNA polymerase sigma-70 factor (ECF subfamily)
MASEPSREVCPMSTTNEYRAALIRSGDAARIARELDPLARRMIRSILYSADADIIETAVSDGLLAVCRSGGAFRGESRVTTWLHTILYRAAMKSARDAARWSRYVSLDDADSARSVQDRTCTTPIPTATLEAWELLGDLVPSPDWRRIWILWNDPGVQRSHEDVARLTGYTPGSVATTLSKIRRRLADHVQE